MENSPSSSRTERKITERNRRNQMKTLYSQLNSLVPRQKPVETTSLPDQLEEAAKYIKRLQTNLEKMRERKESLMGIDNEKDETQKCTSNTAMMGLKSPQVEVREKGSAIEIVLVTGLDFQFMFTETIRLLHEQGVEIVNASFSVVHDTVFHTIHSKAGDSASNGAARISERLKKFVQDYSVLF